MSQAPRGSSAVALGVDRLGIDDVVAVARAGAAVTRLSGDALRGVEATAAWVARTVSQISTSDKPKAYYGINTGFGAQAGRSALGTRYLTQVLGRNLIASHSVGVGPFFDEDVVRAAVLIRAQSLAQGRSGVRAVVVDTLVDMLNAGVYPAIPEQGSLGASGDLAPLAHLALVLAKTPSESEGDLDLHLDPTDGEAFMKCDGPGPAGTILHLTEDYFTGEQTLWRKGRGEEAMAPVGGQIDLQAKEALALMNGSTFSAAIAALVVRDAQNILDHAQLAVAMTLDGIRGFRDPFFAVLHQARGHAAAAVVGARVLDYLAGSELLDPGDLGTDPLRVPPQDRYSVRCAPQVLGSAADTLELARRWVEMDINAATDNPLIFMELERDYKAVSGGNFHGEPIAMAMDFLAIALTDLGNMSDRRMFMLTDYHPQKTYADPESKSGPMHGLPYFLIDEPTRTSGLNSGLMMLQATAAALVSDCKALAHPDSIDSIPSSANQEDHVSMSLNAARHAREIVRNIEIVLAMEILCAAQAIDLQLAKHGNEALSPGRGVAAACATLREAGIAPLTRDRVLRADIRTALKLLRDGTLLQAAREAGR